MPKGIRYPKSRSFSGIAARCVDGTAFDENAHDNCKTHNREHDTPPTTLNEEKIIRHLKYDNSKKGN